MYVKEILSQISMACVVLLCSLSFAAAHSPNQSYIFFTVSDTELSGRFEATTKDLADVIAIDVNGDGDITREEVLTNQDLVFEYFLKNFTASNNGNTIDVTPTEIDFLETTDAIYVQANFEMSGFGDATPEAIEAGYSGFFDDLDRAHEALVVMENNTRTGLEENESKIAAVYSSDTREQTLSLVGQPTLQLLWYFIVQGIWHIWLGFDHVLFLGTLLIPAVMIITNNRWVGAESLREPLITTTKMVTGFTVAHSITLSLAALNLIVLPAWIVESIIALSIAYVALTILLPKLHKNMFLVVVLFGLFHGFGFANVLEPINIEPNQKLITLAGFNLGVEIGQLAIVLVVFPILFALRNTMLYHWGVMKAGSVALILISLFWFEERAFNLIAIRPALEGLIGS